MVDEAAEAETRRVKKEVKKQKKQKREAKTEREQVREAKCVRGRERVEHGMARDSISCEGEVVTRGLRATSMCFFSACFFRLSWVTLLPISAGEQDMEPSVRVCARARECAPPRFTRLLARWRAARLRVRWHDCGARVADVLHSLPPAGVMFYTAVPSLDRWLA